MTAPALRLNEIAKSYPGVRALKDVSFDVQPGHIHALLGENGAGKSTLIRIISGAEIADSGSMTVAGSHYLPGSPVDALRSGVSTLYQEQNLLPDRTVSDNLLMTGQPRRLGLFLDRRAARAATASALARVGAGHISPDALIKDLSVADRQMVDIARALHRESRLLIMDEPTAALSSREVDALFTVLTTLPSSGVTIVFVSHRLDEIFQICDAVTVLRDGEHIRSASIKDLTPDILVRAMVGDAARTVLGARNPITPDEKRLLMRIRGLTGPGFSEIDLDIRSGEILALAGVTGSGKEQVGATVLGAIPTHRGAVEFDGRPIRLSPRRAIAAGIVGVPADRKGEGVIGQMSVRRNLALPSLPALSRLGFLRRRAEQDLAGRQIRNLAIKIRDQNVPVVQLSGGNQQKVALGKWLPGDPRLLVLMEPTQGIDIKVRYEFYRLVCELADGGSAVLLVSSDIPEVLTLADRIVVMRGGAIVGELVGSNATAEALVRLSLGELSEDSAATLHTIDEAVDRTGAHT